MKQNSDNTQGSLIRQLNSFGLHRRELNLSHVPNLLDRNRIKVVHVFDLVCASVVLQPLRWRCVDCVIHHEWDVRKA